jgi:hypothetical protein
MFHHKVLSGSIFFFFSIISPKPFIEAPPGIFPPEGSREMRPLEVLHPGRGIREDLKKSLHISD